MQMLSQSSLFDPLDLLGSYGILWARIVGSHPLLYPGIKPKFLWRILSCLSHQAVQTMGAQQDLDIWGPFLGWLQLSTDP